jgi:tetratricopeptide (TPR) repeat protein
MNGLAGAYGAAGKFDLAMPLWEESLKLTKAKLGADHPQTLSAMNDLATGYLEAGKRDLALPLLEESLKLTKAKLGADHLYTLGAMHNLAMGYRAAGKHDLALPLVLEAATGMEKRCFRDDQAGECVNSLVLCYEHLKRFGEAEVWRRKWLAVVKEQSGADSLPYAGELASLGLNLIQQKKWSEAETVLRDCLAVREKKQPDAWNTFNAQSMLGDALLNQKKYADAEPLLLAGYKGLKQREATIPQPVRKVRLEEALARLVALYEATGKKDEAAKWRKELDAAKAEKD